MLSSKMKMATVAASCAGVGAIAGIAGASAAPSTHTTKATTAAPSASRHRGFGIRIPGHARDGFGPAVHVTATVLNKARTGFITVTEDAGKLQSVSGDQLTIKEAVGKVVDRTVTITVPSSATVRRDGASAALSSLRAGDRVRVVQSSEGNFVQAADATFRRRG